jgi:hypothetical protein
MTINLTHLVFYTARPMIGCYYTAFAQDCSAGSILSAVGLAWQHIYPKDRGDYTPKFKRHTREQVKSAEWLLELVPVWAKEGVAFTEKDRADIYEAQRIVNSARGNDERVD